MSVSVRGVLHRDAVRGPRRARFSSVLYHDTYFGKNIKGGGGEGIVSHDRSFG
jgi:hypothetical protein